MAINPALCGKSHGRRTHRSNTLSNTSADLTRSRSPCGSRPPPPSATTMHPATAAHANWVRACRASCIGGNISQCSSSPTSNASHDDKGPLLLSSPPRTAKRPSLSTHPLQPARTTLIAGISLQVHAVSRAPCAGGSNTSTDDNGVVVSSSPPAQTILGWDDCNDISQFLKQSWCSGVNPISSLEWSRGFRGLPGFEWKGFRI